jgi:hypothetical protein
MIAIPHQNYWSEQTKKNKMGGECSTYGVEDSCIQASDLEKLKERGHLCDLDVDGRIILKIVFKI